jgi:hypothetical protein
MGATFGPRAITAIHLREVLDATIDKLEVSISGLHHDGI